LREIPSTEDGDFTYGKFEERYNADLARGIGNLVARVLKLARQGNFEPKITNKELEKTINDTEKKYKKALEDFKFNESLSSIWELISFCDKYIEKEKPWERKDENVICDLLYAISKISEFLEPFLPETSEKIKSQLKEKNSEPLFPRI
jgi:methionyl-tRNA synthetase